MKEFLENNGYKLWKTETDSFGVSYTYQKRVDNLEEYSHYPLCQCNDKLFINIDSYDYTINGVYSGGCEIYLVHANSIEQWCDLKIYSLTEEEIVGKLPALEKKILDMWNVFYN